VKVLIPLIVSLSVVMCPLVRLSVLAVLLGVPLISAATSPGFPQDLEEVRARANAEIVAELEELANFCQKSRAYLERDRAYECLLVLVPDHKKARKTLGWAWDRKAGEWARRRKYRPPENNKPEPAREARERRDALLAGHRDRMLALLRDTEGVTLAQREAEIALLLRVNPDDPVLRDLNGEVKEVDGSGNERWVRKTTKRAFGTRQALEEQLREALDAIELTDFEAEPWETGHKLYYGVLLCDHLEQAGTSLGVADI